MLIANGQSQLKNPGTKHWWWLNPLRAAVGVPFLIAALPVLALNPDKSLLQYNCRAWTRQNGLPANGVKAIAQTRDGYLWLGTAQGLVRFDGVEFKLAEMPKSPSLDRQCHLSGQFPKRRIVVRLVPQCIWILQR